MQPLPKGCNPDSDRSNRCSGKISYMEVGKMITSTSNQRIKELSQIQKKSKVRSREGVFVAEGIRMVRETPYERLVRPVFFGEF